MFITTLKSVDTGLKNQVDALEEAGVISAGEAGSGEGIATGLATGRLDVAWLNSRRDDVTWGLERALVRRAGEIVGGRGGG